MTHCLGFSSHYNGEDGDKNLRASSFSTLPPPLPPSGQHYDVFLSFRGETRRGFTDYLYKRLKNIGILVFRDREGLPVGERNQLELLKAIMASKISILIISPEYTSSEWCLKELVQILKCSKAFGQLVIPIFYRVKPSDVRKQSDNLEKVFQPYKEKPDYDGTLVQESKDALMEVSYLTGFESEKIADGYEGELVEIVVAKILKALKMPTLVVSDHLVGVENHVKNILNMVNVEGPNDVRAILIHGMGGIGKTTLAKVVYNQLFKHFEHHTYIADIRETSLQYKGKEVLQKQLISDILGEKWPHDISNVDEGVNIIRDRFNQKKVLLLLDDIDHRDQLNALVGKQDWCGKGSMLIITSRRQDILEKWEGSFNYELNELNFDQSFELFFKHAFKRRDFIPDEYYTVTKEIVATTGGLPLAIEVIGSFLCGKTKDIWEDNLKMLKEIPHHEVQSKLKISIDALQPEEKEIFLDIACLPLSDINRNECAAFHMWDSCDFYPQVRINKLISMSLIKIEVRKNMFGGKKEIIIHDQLRDLGREMVRQESILDLGKRSRLWMEEAWEVLQPKQGEVEVQTLDLLSDDLVHCTSKQFEGMAKLKFLRMQGVLLEGDFGNQFQNLRWLQWYITNETIYTDFRRTNFNFRKLVILELRKSNITEYWEGWSQIKHLKVLSLWECNYLATSPDFSAMKELEVLILVSCSRLRKIHPSIGKLCKTLKVLDVRGCSKLKELPLEVGKMEELRALLINDTRIRKIPVSEGCMTKLKGLSAAYCYYLEELPIEVGKMDELRYLNIRGTGIKKIPTLEGLMTKLEYLSAYGCKGLTSIRKLKLLTYLDLCLTGVTELPDTIGDLYNLEVLHVSGTPIKCLPTSIRMLSKLQVLTLWSCCKLELLPKLPSSLMLLSFNGDSMETLPDFSNLTNLNELNYKDLFERRKRTLNLENLNRLRTLRILPSTSKLHVSDSQEIEVLDSEEEIDLSDENINFLPELPTSLVYLKINQCQTLHTLPNLSNLKNLVDLRVYQCSELVEINGLEGAESLIYLHIESCRKLSKLNGVRLWVTTMELINLDALESLPHFSTAKKLKNLYISRCSNLVEIQGLGNVQDVQSVVIDKCSSLERIGDLSHLKILTTLKLCDCQELSDVRGIEQLASLTSLSFHGCHPKVKFPDLSMLTNLKDLSIMDEEILKILGLQELKSLENFDIFGCVSLQNLPNLSHFTNLRKLDVHHCEKLLEIQGLENLTLLKELDIRGCSILQNLSDLLNVKILSDPHEEKEEKGYLPNHSQFTNSIDIVEKRGRFSKCFYLVRQKLRALLTHLRDRKKRQICYKSHN